MSLPAALERRLALAGKLLVGGLLLAVPTFLFLHPLLLFGFLLAAALVVGGILVFLWALVAPEATGERGG